MIAMSIIVLLQPKIKNKLMPKYGNTTIVTFSVCQGYMDPSKALSLSFSLSLLGLEPTISPITLFLYGNEKYLELEFLGIYGTTNDQITLAIN